jgi:ATP-dependent DNA helicase RecG
MSQTPRKLTARPGDLNAYFADVTSLKGVGDKVGEALTRAMGPRIRDLVLTPPTGLIDRTNRPTIAGAREGEVATFEVTIGRHIAPKARNRPYRVRVFDDSGDMTLTWFKAYPQSMEKLIPEGTRRIISGKCEVFNAELQMTHPDYVLKPENADDLPELETLYPLTAGLGQKTARKSINSALDKVLAGAELGNWLEPAFQTQQDWPDYRKALTLLHRPEHIVDIKEDSPVRRRLAYDELLAKQLAMALVRERNRGTGGQALSAKGDYVDDVLKAAPFPPTGAQARALEEIKADMASSNRMSRLLQGDVGAGKTFVAALACAYAAEAGVQVALMAPTEILARQHVDTLAKFLEPAGLTVKGVTGRDKGKSRDALATGMAEGYIDVVVGTHALFQDKTKFKNLGLVIIDEQHRFGVRDRLRLTEKGHATDLLVMTATPYHGRLR